MAKATWDERSKPKPSYPPASLDEALPYNLVTLFDRVILGVSMDA